MATNSDQLVPLHGTPRQVKWAADIRARILAGVPGLDARLAAWAASVHAVEDADRIEAFHTRAVATYRALDAIKAKRPAAWWISHRTMPLQDLIRQLHRSN